MIDFYFFWFVFIQSKSSEKLLHWAFKWAGDTNSWPRSKIYRFWVFSIKSFKFLDRRWVSFRCIQVYFLQILVFTWTLIKKYKQNCWNLKIWEEGTGDECEKKVKIGAGQERWNSLYWIGWMVVEALLEDLLWLYLPLLVSPPQLSPIIEVALMLIA